MEGISHLGEHLGAREWAIELQADVEGVQKGSWPLVIFVFDVPPACMLVIFSLWDYFLELTLT